MLRDQGVDHDDLSSGLIESQGKVRADESHAAGDEAVPSDPVSYGTHEYLTTLTPRNIIQKPANIRTEMRTERSCSMSRIAIAMVSGTANWTH